MVSATDNCLGRECDEHIDALLAESDTLTSATDPSARTLACVAYFGAWRSLTDCLGQVAGIPAGLAIQGICTRIAEGGF